jgi:predicted kinase
MKSPLETSSLFRVLQHGRLSRAYIERFATELAARQGSHAAALGYAKHVGSILRHVFLHEGRMVLEPLGALGLPDEAAGTASDVLGVLLELEAFGQAQLGHWFLASWLLQSGAFDALQAMRQPGARAVRCTREPFLAITHGLSGAGKTTLVNALVAATGALIVSNDAEAVRLRRSGVKLEQGVIARRLESLTEQCVHAGWPVIVESCFLSRDDRSRFRAKARALGVPFAVLACTAPLSSIAERLERRRSFGSLFHGVDASADSVRRQLEAQIARTDPLDESERAHAVMVDTAAPADVARLTAQLFVALDRSEPDTWRSPEPSRRSGAQASESRRGYDG